MKVIRLKDIAQEVNVSTTAVSKVLNNSPMRISNTKKQKIIETALRLHYRPNMLARSLHNKVTKSIGIIIPSMNTLFYPELIRAIEVKLSSHGYQSIICNTGDDPVLERSHIENLLSRLVDGLIIVPIPGKSNIKLFRHIRESGRPIIIMERYFPDEKLSYVITDNKKGARKGVSCLKKQGIKKIIYLGKKTRELVLDDRLSCVKEESKRQGIAFNNKDIFLCNINHKQLKKTCGLIFKKNLNHTTIFIEHNTLLMGLLEAAGEKGLFIPDDFGIIGFDTFLPNYADSESFKYSKVLKAPIPVIRQDIARMGDLVSEYLISSFAGRSTRRKWQIKIPPRIIIS